ncbi:MAG: M16 family metallopeptidase, partial [Gammaproteobacteria bacterium]
MSRLLAACLMFFAVAEAGLAQGVTLPDVTRVVLDNGAVLLIHEKRDVPLVGAQVVVRGGATTDPEGSSGLSSLFAGMLERGAGERSAADFAEAIDAVGGSLSTAAGLESITIKAEFLARDADLLVELLTDMLQAPALKSAEVNKLRDRRINQIRAVKDSGLRQLAPIYGNAFLFGEHPYARAVDGSEESLAKIRQRDLLAYYRDHVGGDRLIISIAGDIDAAAMIDQLSAAFGDWRAAQAALPEIEPATPEEGRRVLLVDAGDAAQSYFWIGNVGVAIDFAQRAELDIANTLFGGRFTSLLMNEMRTKAGLTYGARTILLRPSTPGSVAISSFTKTETTIEAIDLALALLAQLHETGFDEASIQSGKNYILGQFPPRLETATQLAGQFAVLEAHGLSTSFVDDYGNAVTAADPETIRAVIGDIYPDLDNLV